MPHITFSCPRELITRLDDAAAAEGTGNRSKFIVYALEKYLSGSLSVDMISPESSYSQDNTKVLLLEKEVIHRDELLAERERVINAYLTFLGGNQQKSADLPTSISQPQANTPKKSWFARHFRNKE